MLFRYHKTSDITIYLFAFCLASFPAVASISLLFLVFGGLFFYYKNKPKLFPKNLLPFGLLFLIYLVGLLYSCNQEYAFNVILKISALLIIPISFFLRGKVNIRTFQLTKQYFVLGTFFWCVSSLSLSLIKYVISGDLYSLTYYGLSEILHLHPTYQSFYILASIFFLPNCPSLNKFLKTILYLFFVFFLILLESRIAYISLVIIILFQVFWFLKKSALRVLLITVPLFIIFVVYINPFSKRLSELNSFEYSFREIGTIEENGINQRVWLWKNALKQIKDSPFFGYGLGSQKNNYEWVIEKDLLYNSYNEQYTQSAKKLSEYNLHNQYLQYLYEFGLLGLLLFCYVLFIFGSYLWEKGLFREILIFSIFCIFMLTENMLDRQMGIYVFAFITSLFVFSDSSNKNSDLEATLKTTKSK